jgi:hypothetical protein
MTNIELELVSDINLDQAFLVLARTLAAGRSTHRARGLAAKTDPKAPPACAQASRLARQWFCGRGPLGPRGLQAPYGLGTPRANRPDPGREPKVGRGHNRLRPDAAFHRRGTNAANVNLPPFVPLPPVQLLYHQVLLLLLSPAPGGRARLHVCGGRARVPPALFVLLPGALTADNIAFSDRDRDSLSPLLGRWGKCAVPAALPRISRPRNFASSAELPSKLPA